MSFQAPPQQQSKADQLAALDMTLRDELGPGFFVCIPRSKQGYDGGGGTTTSIINELGRQGVRISKINYALERMGLSGDDPDVLKVINQYRDTFFSPIGGPIWHLRNKCVQNFMSTGYGEAILWIDGDIEWKAEELEAFRRSYQAHPEFEIFGAVVSTRTKDRLPCIYGWDDERKAFPRLNVVPPGDVIEVKGLGAAFTAVRRTLIQRMKPVRDGWYWQVYELSEDLYFCTRAVHECGARIGVDMTIRPRHIGLHGFSYAEEPDDLRYIRTDMMERFGDAIARYLYKVPTVVDKLFKEAHTDSMMSRDKNDEAIAQMVEAFANDLRAQLEKAHGSGTDHQADGSAVARGG